MSQNRRMLLFMLALLAISLLPVTASAQPIPESQSALLSDYILSGPGSVANYDATKFTPNGMVTGKAVDPYGDWVVTDPSTYAGWSTLAPPHPKPGESNYVYVYTSDDWLTLRLKASAQVGIAWMGGAQVPDWLASWPKSGSVQINKKAATVYLKSFPAGDVHLGSYGINGSWGGPYVVILNEPQSQPSPSPQPSPTPSPQPSPTSQPVIITGYTLSGPGSVANYDNARFTPNGLVAGKVVDPFGDWVVTDPSTYTGWSTLAPPHPKPGEGNYTYIYSSDAWLTVKLRRSTQVGIAWMGGAQVPDWLASWPKSGSVQINKKAATVYLKSFPAGDVQLGSYGINGSWGGPYVVLLSDPRSDADVAPNQSCPQWLHDQWTTTGPDGEVYRTWHPQIDPVYWCYYEHEHGTDPSLIDPNFHPLYDQVDGAKSGYAESAMGMVMEGHTGYKSYGFREADGSNWYITQHMGTAGHARICKSMHTLDVAAWNSAGQKIADTHMVGDFGKSVRFDGTEYTFTPTDCPEQAKGVGNGVRKIPSYQNGQIVGPYEPWRVSDSLTRDQTLGLGLNSLLFAADNPMAICAEGDTECNNLQDTGRSGAGRFIQASDGISLRAGANTGTFCTDAMAEKVLPCGPNTVQQFIAPGARADTVLLRGKCRDHDGFGALWWCNVGNPSWPSDAERENSIVSPN